MKKYFHGICVFILCMCINVSVQAAESPWYIGAKAGQMMVDVSGLGDATNVGILLGYDFSDIDSGGFAVEGEYTTAISEGDATIFSFTGNWDVNTLAIYGVYRSSGEAYFKGKLGYLNEDVKVSISGFPSAAGSESGLSIGVGGGWHVGDAGSLELEYTIIEEDIGFFSIGYNYHY